MRGTSAPVFVEPMLLGSGGALPAGSGWWAQLKLDGARGQLRVLAGEAALRTRRGRRCDHEFPEIIAGAVGLPDVVLDGEIVVAGRQGHPDFGLLRARLGVSARRGRLLSILHPAVFYAFDVLWHRGVDVRQWPLSRRRDVLQALPAAPGIAVVDLHPGGAQDVLAFAREHQLEGAVVKRADSAYRSGRSMAWRKFKVRHAQQLWVTGWRPGAAGEPDRYWVGRYADGGWSAAGEVAFGLPRGQASTLRPILRAASLGRSHTGLSPVAPVVAMTVESHGPTAGWLRDPIITNVRVDPAGPTSA